MDIFVYSLHLLPRVNNLLDVMIDVLFRQNTVLWMRVFEWIIVTWPLHTVCK